MPLHSSLGVRVRLCLKKIKKIRAEINVIEDEKTIKSMNPKDGSEKISKTDKPLTIMPRIKKERGHKLPTLGMREVLWLQIPRY